ncbi:MAG: PilN domain-containing protein [Comamonas sp.]
MSALSTESRFFGIDLQKLTTEIRQTWRKAPFWPPFSWLRPDAVVRLLPVQGEPIQVWESGRPVEGKVRFRTDFWAIELPESLVLRKSLQLPALDPQDCASAAQLEAQAISPFAQEDMLWGYVEQSRSASAVRLQLALASRKQVEPYLEGRTADAVRVQTAGKVLPAPEVWVLTGRERPIVFQGFGEAQRAVWAHKKLQLHGAGVLGALLLLIGIAITPTAQLRLRAIEAIHAYEAIAAKTGDVVAKRASLTQSADQVAGLADMLAERVDSIKVLSMLTKVLPDDTALQSARIQGSKVTITGLGDNASTLMQKLSEQEGVKDVRAPSAATRAPGSNKESFTIELMLEPKVYGPTLKELEPPPPPTPAAPSPQPANSASVQGQPAAPATVAPPVAAPVAPAIAPAAGSAPAASAPRASLGGRATRAAPVSGEGEKK